MLAFGSYSPVVSAVHQMNAQVKVILACAFSICAVTASSWLALGLLWIAVAVGFVVAKLNLRCMAAGVAPIAVLLLFTVAAHALSYTGAGSAAAHQQATVGSLGLMGALELPWGLQLSADGFAQGCFFALRIALALSACALLTSTTSQTAVVQALQGFLRPGRVLHIPVDDICMIISIALRFVPTVTNELYAIKRARQARGSCFEGAGLSNAVKAWTHTITPLFVSLFRRADILARAMDARCYGASLRTSMSTAAMRPADVCVAVLGVVGMVCIVTLL